MNDRIVSDSMNPPQGSEVRVEPRYDLSPEELQELNEQMVALAQERFPEEGVHAFWISPYHRFANFIRTHEASHFPEVAEVDGEEEDGTLFLALVDTRAANQRVVHGATISGIRDESVIASETAPDEPTGFISVDDLISIPGNFTAQAFRDYYEAKGIDIERSIGIETNFRIPRDSGRIESFNGLGMADLAYLTMFNLLAPRAHDDKDVAAFASINRDSVNSFKRVGIYCEPLMGREDLVTPEAALGLDFQPVAIPIVPNRPVFEALASLSLAEVRL